MKQMTTPLLLAVMGLVAIPSVSSADHCSEIRRDYNCRLEALEDRYHAERRGLTDRYHHQRDHFHRRLRHANRLPECERRNARNAIKHNLRVAESAYEARMDQVVVCFKRDRRALIDEREALVRACRRGTCDVCRPAPAASPIYEFERPVTPSLQNPYHRDHLDSTFPELNAPRLDAPSRIDPEVVPPIPTPRTSYRVYRGSHARSGHRHRPGPSRSLDWGDVVMQLIAHRMAH